MPKKTGFIKKHTPMFNKPSKFEERWGEPAYKIAEREDVSITSIHMRVRNWGNPYQRKSKPSKWEEKYGKTMNEICDDLYIHPVTLLLRERTHNNVYCEDTIKQTKKRNKKLDIYKHTKHWKELPNLKDTGFWLMPEHPRYELERNKCMLWDIDKHKKIAKFKAHL